RRGHATGARGTRLAASRPAGRGAAWRTAQPPVHGAAARGVGHGQLSRGRGPLPPADRPAGGFSRQAWGLAEKLRQANRLYAGLPHRLFEVHPEISFAELGGGEPVAAGKKTWNGQMTRRALLGAAGIVLPDVLAGAGTVPADDILDAAAGRGAPSRIARGGASSLPSPPPVR